jgi:uncharacterized Tic20 family protein
MPIAVICPRCKAKMKAPDTLVGKIVKCPGCATSVLIPAAGAPQPVPASGAAGRPTPPPASASAPPPHAIVDRLEEVPDKDEVADVLPAEEADEVVEEVEAIEEETDDLEVVSDRPRPKKKGRGVTEAERTTAMLLYFSSFLFGIFGPLIIWLVKKADSKYIDHHGKSALNFLLSVGIPSTIVCITAGGAAALLNIAGFGLALLMFSTLSLISLYATVLLIIFAVKAKNGDWSVLPAWIELF